jgi:TonB family protein
VVRWRDPPLPAVLRRTGQEAECEAEITVAPSGAILHVEITKGSGYTDIDASVEAALRDNLFSRVSGRTDTIATVRYKFRPEKQD